MAGLKTALLIFGTPARALTIAVQERRFTWPILLATGVALAFTALAVPRVDFAKAAEDALDSTPAEAAKLTPHEREEKIATGAKVSAIYAFAASGAGPALSSLAAALFLWLGFKVAAGKPDLGATLAVAAHAALPLALKQLLTLPALLRSSGLAVADLERLLPSSLASLAAPGTSLPKLALLGSIDLFALWSVGLAALGMARVAHVSWLRSSMVVGALWATFVLVFRFSLPSLAAAS